MNAPEPTEARLQWPTGWPRTTARRRAAFKTTINSAAQGLADELRLLGAQSIVISTMLPSRRDGLPASSSGAEPTDPGAAVYWTIGTETRVMACDRWDRVRDNLHALELSIAAMRGISRWGASDMVSRAFSGFAALPPAPPEAPKAPTIEGWALWFLQRDVGATLEEYEEAFRTRAKEIHPDVGGSDRDMANLNRAIEHVRKVFGKE